MILKIDTAPDTVPRLMQRPRTAIRKAELINLCSPNERIHMNTKALNEQEVIHEAMTVLLEHLDPAKVAKFLAARPISGADYLVLREKIFAAETVESLSRKIREFEGGTPPQQHDQP